jgi:hypothetical protein
MTTPFVIEIEGAVVVCDGIVNRPLVVRNELEMPDPKNLCPFEREKPWFIPICEEAEELPGKT